MELATLTPSHIHRTDHPAPGEEDQTQTSTSPRAPPPTSPKSRSISKIHEATSLLSQVRTWWSNNIRLVVVLHNPAEPVPSSAEGQGQTQAQGQAQAQDQAQDQPNLKPPTTSAPTNAPPTKNKPAEEPSPSLDHRDFLALERTFLSYVRTSIALVSFGVIVTQLFMLPKLNPTIGVAMGCVSEAAGMVIVLVGCVRYFRQQKLLVRGKMVAAGWDLMAILAILGGVLLGIFVVVLVQ